MKIEKYKKIEYSDHLSLFIKQGIRIFLSSKNADKF